VRSNLFNDPEEIVMMQMEARAEQRQNQTLSPRLQHAVRLLQMSSLDFGTVVRDVLGRNPFLETEDGFEDEIDIAE
jgi:RNA polymerase sigma-54 factor